MTNEQRDDDFEQPPVQAASLPVGTRFRIQAAGSLGDTWMTMLKGGRVQLGQASDRIKHTATVDPNAVVIDAIIPEKEETETRLKHERESNGEKDVWMRAPEWALRLEQGKVRHKTERALNGLPVYGPDKNPLDRERRKAAWKNIPMDSFFVILEQNPRASVYAKTNFDRCQRVCSLEQWSSGDVPFTWRDTGENEKKIADLELKEESVVTVLNAPTPAETKEYMDAYRRRMEEGGRAIEPRQEEIFQGIQNLSDNFSVAA